MALYPTTTLDITTITGMTCVDPGSLLAIPITIPAGGGILLAMVQLSPTQDYSLRVWVSLKSCGDFLPTNASYWHLNRNNDQMTLVYDGTTPLPDTYTNVNGVPLLPGNYVLNVLNLVNTENVFSFSSNDVVF